MALHWTWRPRSATHKLLTALGSKSSAGKGFTGEAVKSAHEELRRARLLVEHPQRQGYWQLADAVRVPLYRQLLDDTPIADLRAALQTAEAYDPARAPYRWMLLDASATVALVRLEVLAGTSAQTLGEIKDQIARVQDWNRILHAACFDGFDAALFERIVPEWRWGLAYYAAVVVCTDWQFDLLPIYRWALAKLDSDAASMPPRLRLQLAEGLLHAGERERVLSLLAADHSGAADALRAAVAVQQGRWTDGQSGFEAAFKKLQVDLNARKRAAPNVAGMAVSARAPGATDPEAS